MTLPTFRRPILKVFLQRLREPRRALQAVVGPRQTGKTVLVRQAIGELNISHHYASADEPSLRDSSWLAAQWEVGRMRAKDAGRAGAVLVLDEAQKVERWEETIKRLWDEDTASGAALKVVVLGSAPALVQGCLQDQLPGRVEVLRAPHWTYPEMRAAFGWNLEQYLFFGGYPGGADLLPDEERWRRAVLDGLLETALARDILLQVRVDKPALLRQFFRLGCERSAEVLSYQKMLGRLTGAGNTVTLAHYLDLLSGIGLMTGLQKHAGARVKKRGSSPKLLALNTALMTSASELSFSAARENREVWGRLVESAVGAHLVNGLPDGVSVLYWREANREVDYILKHKGRVTAVEVVTARRRETLPGMAAFSAEFHVHKRLVVGGAALPLEDFLSSPPERWLTP
ncbi:MAG: ATP-binding protein [Elusimicrobia bacterium]|nr:ATP-binding protein [Elusimicrobiota bacterium]